MVDVPEGMILVPDGGDVSRLPRARTDVCKYTMLLMNVFLCCRELIELIVDCCIVALEQEEEQQQEEEEE